LAKFFTIDGRMLCRPALDGLPEYLVCK